MRRTKEDALRTREAVLDAAERVFFEHGVARTTLEHIARAAGVTRGAIYWHFQNKAAVLDAVLMRVRMPMEEVFDRVMEAEAENAVQRLEELCCASLVELYRDERRRRVYTVLLLKCEYSEEMAALMERAREWKEKTVTSLTLFFDRLQTVGQVTTALEPRALALALHAFVVGLFSDYLRAPEQYDMPDDAAKLIRPFFAFLKPTAAA